MNTVTDFTITTSGHDATIFAPNQKLVLVDADSYQRLIDMLTPEQHTELYALALADRYVAIAGRLI